MELSSDHLKTATSVVTEMNTLIDPVRQKQPGAREGLLALSHRLTAMLETPSETIRGLAGQRYGVGLEGKWDSTESRD